MGQTEKKKDWNDLVWIKPNRSMGNKLPTRTENVGRSDGNIVGRLFGFLPQKSLQRGQVYKIVTI